MNPEKTLQGKLILDSGKLIGSYFGRTVILICRHDETGTFGLILNRPVGQTLGAVVKGVLTGGLAKTSLHLGGPVQTEALSFLRETETRPEFEILPELMLEHSLSELKEQCVSDDSKLRLRAYIGYAGWTAGQLEDEMKMGSWMIHPAKISRIFDPRPELLWFQMMQEKGGIYDLIAKFPNNPLLN